MDPLFSLRDQRGLHTSTVRTGNTSYSLTALSRALKMSDVLRVRAWPLSARTFQAPKCSMHAVMPYGFHITPTKITTALTWFPWWTKIAEVADCTKEVRIVSDLQGKTIEIGPTIVGDTYVRSAFYIWRGNGPAVLTHRFPSEHRTPSCCELRAVVPKLVGSVSV